MIGFRSDDAASSRRDSSRAPGRSEAGAGPDGGVAGAERGLRAVSGARKTIRNAAVGSHAAAAAENTAAAPAHNTAPRGGLLGAATNSSSCRAPARSGPYSSRAVQVHFSGFSELQHTRTVSVDRPCVRVHSTQRWHWLGLWLGQRLGQRLRPGLGRRLPHWPLIRACRWFVADFRRGGSMTPRSRT